MHLALIYFFTAQSYPQAAIIESLAYYASELNIAFIYPIDK
ncbi:hypothetical protein HMPREF0693_2394 [Proteus mirabilis ATCC 29906]|nr:hypothetical protein HMPREF0693_2394 [Proteus mirabilis ATCC 29906]KXC00823.1 hypothetical protein HMPREF3203_01680 [Proteus mirabilis]PVF72129.1 hypothetical protein CSC14_1491 [Proteus mirabilis]